MKIVVTGARGFVGRNLTARLSRQAGVEVAAFDATDSVVALMSAVESCDVIFHLAGVNRPLHEKDFEATNVGLTQQLCATIEHLSRPPTIVFASSVQAGFDNEYGKSKRRAEELLSDLSLRSGAAVAVFRLTNVFGKWSRPHYNSVVATFCYQVARDLQIAITDQDRELTLVYIDDVIEAFIKCVGTSLKGFEMLEVEPVYRISLGRLADLIRSFRASRDSLTVPDMADPLVRRLYATYMSYLDRTEFAYPVACRTDHRGQLGEILKSTRFGQIFVSRTLPGVTRGNHYHDSKVEKFVVLEGDAVIRFRPVGGSTVTEYRVNGDELSVVDIPPGYTHSIENVGASEMIVLFWANEIFESALPDTYQLDVLGDRL